MHIHKDESPSRLHVYGNGKQASEAFAGGDYQLQSVIRRGSAKNILSSQSVD
jgi:hypothetical protein